MRATILAAFFAVALAAPASAQCAGDLNGDSQVNGADLGILLNAWGPCPNGNPGCPGDLDADGSVGGSVDGADLGILLASWGDCPGTVVPSWATLVEAQPDPAVVTDQALRAAIVATGLAWRVRDTATQIEMLVVPPGTFQMGCIMGSNLYGCNSWEQPVHQVTLTNAFYLGRYEVTQAQWTARMGSNPSGTQGYPDSASRPVEAVGWDTIQGFLAATGMRLPTEAEWEYACRAGTQTPFYNGSTDDNSLGALAWYGWCCGGNSGIPTHPVGGKAANAFGFHDMLGNVWEWVNDRWGGYSANAQTNPTGPASGSYRVLRGGSCLTALRFVRSSYRDIESPGLEYDHFGFRVARTP
jgi:formylglycine-generating enzyme required for sulfatase activity